MLSFETLNAVAGAVNGAHDCLVEACVALASDPAAVTDAELFRHVLELRHAVASLDSRIMKRIAVERGEERLASAAVEVRP